MRNPSLLVGSALITLVVVAAVFPALLAPYDPLEQGAVLQQIDGRWTAPPFPPSTTYWLGSDLRARDLLSRIIYGTRATLLIAFLATCARVGLGFALGWAAANYGGGLRRSLLLLTTISATLPSLLFAYVFIATIGPQRGLPVFILALSLTGWAAWAHVTMDAIRRIQAEPYMEAAEAIGTTSWYKTRYYYWPNLLPTVIPAAALEFAAALLVLAELGFLGIYVGSERLFRLQDLISGEQPQLAIPEWGGMLAGTRLEIFRWYWLSIMPAAAFMITILGLSLWADGMRRVLERR